MKHFPTKNTRTRDLSKRRRRCLDSLSCTVVLVHETNSWKSDNALEMSEINLLSNPQWYLS